MDATMKQLQAQSSNLFFQPVSSAVDYADRTSGLTQLFFALLAALRGLRSAMAERMVARHSGRSWCDATEREIIDGITDPTRRRY